MVPADKSFKTDDSPINQGFGLIDKLELAVFKGRSEVMLKLAMLAQLAIHFRFKEPIGAGTFCRSAIECCVGIANEFLGVGGVIWVDRHPYAGIRREFLAINLHGIAETRSNPFYQTSSRVKKLGPGYDNCEFVTADARKEGAADCGF